MKAPNFSVFPQQAPPRARRQSQRSIFPVSNDADRPSSRKSNKESLVPVPTIPTGYFPPRSPTTDQSPFPKPGPWSPERPVICESVVSKQRVSVYQPQRTPHSREASPEASRSRSRADSIAAAIAYSRTITPDTKDPTRSQSQHQPRTRSQSSEARGGTRSRSTSSQRTRAISRTQDSLRRHSRKLSQDRSAADSNIEKRRSRDRDQIHFDPSHHRRNRSGSVQGRAVDFDHPRESPFSNSHAIGSDDGKEIADPAVHNVPNNFPGASGTGLDTHVLVKKDHVRDVMPPRSPRLELDLTVDKDRLRVHPHAPGAAQGWVNPSAEKGRSASEASQSSIGEFYDAYYRQSVLAQRAAVASKVLGMNAQTPGVGAPLGVGMALGMEMVGVHGSGSGSVHEGAMNSSPPRRPPPMNFSRGAAGFSGASLNPQDTIVEMPSPAPSPLPPKERYPALVRF